MDKPKMQYVNFYRSEGNYNWLDSKDVSAQYVFRFPHLTREELKELEIKTSFLIDIEKDYDYSPESYTALELAHEIRYIYDSYWMHSGKSEIQKLVDYLESIEEDQEKLRHEYEVENAKYQVYYWQNELSRLEEVEV